MKWRAKYEIVKLLELPIFRISARSPPPPPAENQVSGSQEAGLSGPAADGPQQPDQPDPDLPGRENEKTWEFTKLSWLKVYFSFYNAGSEGSKILGFFLLLNVYLIIFCFKSNYSLLNHIFMFL